MSYPRVKPIDPPYTEELSKVFQRLMPPGFDPILLFRTIAHNPRILKKFQRSNLLDPGSITQREREIVILRTCARCGAEYEWGVHVGFFSDRVKLTREQIRATTLETMPEDIWNQKENLLIQLVDELHDTANITDTLWSNLVNEWKADQLIELIVLAGFYHTVSFVINGLKIDLEALAPTYADYTTS